MKINWQKEIIWKIRLGELAVVFLMYILMYLTYSFTLAYSNTSWEKTPFPMQFKSYLITHTINYSLNFVLTIPVWYFFFKIIPHWRLQNKALLHLPILILFVATWKWLFYTTLETLNRGHLEGSGQVWDIYIPALLYIVQFGFFHTYTYHTQFQKQKENEAKLKESSYKSELSAIKAQLNPHFLYNIFNTISASVPPEMEQTREMIATLSDMFRYQLMASKEDLVELQHELDFVEKYIFLEKNRFGERLKVHFDVNKELMNAKIPPMILQPLVENCIKHGISPLIEGGEINISIKRIENKLNFKISDSGKGVENIEEIFGVGIGLTNTKLRLEKMFKSTLEVRNNIPKGLVVSFSI
jgi:two-component system, LytTR family, sensor kinase